MSLSTNLFSRRRFLWLSAVAASALTLGACASNEEPAEGPASSTSFDEGTAGAPGQHMENTMKSAVDSTAVTSRIGSMTLEQKVAQLFVVAPEALVEGVSRVTQAGDATKEAVGRWPVGGIIYFADNLVDPEQTRAMLSKVKGFYGEEGNVQPFIAVDEEGGTVVRIAGNEAFGVLNVGDAAAFGNAGDAAAAQRAAERIADYLKPLGFNVDFAPVADVVDPTRSDTMGLRSFSSGAQMAATMVEAQVKGFRDKGMICCAKHFPGIGSAPGDSHTGAITVEKTLPELEEVDFVPFKAAIAAGVPMVMVGHASLPAVAGNDVPAPLNEAVVQKLLREKLGFTGIVVTDSLSMGAVTDRYGPAEAAVAALKAGCDIPLMPANFAEAYQGVLDAVATGELTETRINESIARILTAKSEYFDSL